MTTSSPLIPAYDNVAGNYYDKYNSKNPIARWLMAGFLTAFDDLVATTNSQEILEIGCGEGHLSMRMARQGLNVRGYDLEEVAIDQARANAREATLNIGFDVRDLYALGAEDAADFVVCCEVMEHVPDPEQALIVLKSLARKWLLLSVPREPIWRSMNMARGKYWNELGNTPGHIQHWSAAGFRRLVSRHVRIMEIRQPLPWTMLLCRV